MNQGLTLQLPEQLDEEQHRSALKMVRETYRYLHHEHGVEAKLAMRYSQLNTVLPMVMPQVVGEEEYLELEEEVTELRGEMKNRTISRSTRLRALVQRYEQALEEYEALAAAVPEPQLVEVGTGPAEVGNA